MKVNVINRWGGPFPLMCNHACMVASIAAAQLIELAQLRREAWDEVFTLYCQLTPMAVQSEGGTPVALD